MKTLRLHFVIVVLCGFSFVLLAGKFTFKKSKVDFDVHQKPVTEVRDIPRNRLVNIKEFKEISGLKEESTNIKNGSIK